MPFRPNFQSSLLPVTVAIIASFTWGTLRPDIDPRTYFSITFAVLGGAIAYIGYRVYCVQKDSKEHRRRLQEQVESMNRTIQENRRFFGGAAQ